MRQRRARTMSTQSPGSSNGESTLLHELVEAASVRAPDRPAVTFGSETLDYLTLAEKVRAFASGLMAIALNRSERVGVYLEKRVETVVAMFGTAAAGGVFVPINPLLKADQVGYILRDCNVRVLVTSPERLSQLDATLPECPDLRHVVVTPSAMAPPSAVLPVHRWADWIGLPPAHGAPGDRRRHGSNPLHVRQHRQTEGRGAVASQHGDRCEERRVLSRESC